MVTTLLLRDLRLERGDRARTIGTLDPVGSGSAGQPLWVEPHWRPYDGTRLDGGSIGVTFQPGSVDTTVLDHSTRVVVEGRWNGEGLERASCQLVTDPQPMPTVRGVDPPAPATYTEDEWAGFHHEMRDAAGSLLLTGGGTADSLSVQLLYVTDDFLEWYAGFSAVRVDVHVSVYPVR